MRGQTKQYQAR